MASNSSHFGIRKFFVGPNELSSTPVIKLTDHQLTLKRKLLQDNEKEISQQPQQLSTDSTPVTPTGEVVPLKKRGKYRTYSAEYQQKVGTYAAQYGLKKTAYHFRNDFNGKGVPKGSIEEFRRRVVHRIPAKKRLGRQPIIPKDILNELEQLIKGLSTAGAPIHLLTVQSSLRALLVTRGKANLLKERNFKVSPSWCTKWLQKINFSFRKVTKGKLDKPVIELQKKKVDFIDRIAIMVLSNHIPKELVINFDQTGLHLAPVRNSTFCPTGSKQVIVRFGKDKRQITALMAGTASGALLPCQVIFQGKTDKCHPKIDCPPGWLVSHSPNHWSNLETMKQWLENIAIPWRNAQIAKLGLKFDQKALLLFDCWSVHKTEEWITACKNAGFEVVFIPAGFTDNLQPMDLAINKVFKDHIKARFDEYLVSQITEKWQKNENTSELPITLPELKCKIVEWADMSHAKIVLDQKAVLKGFESAGILTAWNKEVQDRASLRASTLFTSDVTGVPPSVTSNRYDDHDDYEPEEDEEEDVDINTITELDVADTEENTSTMINLIFQKDAEQENDPTPTNPANAYAKAYYNTRKQYTPVPGRSLSAQYRFLCNEK